MAFDTLLQLFTTLEYGAIAWHMIRQSVIRLPSPYTDLSLGIHFGVIVLRTVTMIFWSDFPVQWNHIHRITAAICLMAIAYDYLQEQRINDG